MNTHIVTLARGAVALFALAASAGEPGKLLGVRAGADAQASTLTIEGSRPLSFTTLKLENPPRVVVDFADTEIGADQRELEVGDGTLRRAAIAQAGSHTARVVLELSADAEFEVRAEGNQVEVRIPHPALAPAATTKEETPPAAAAQAEAEKVASLPTVSLVPSRPVEPPLPDPRTDRQRLALEKATAVKKALAEKRALAEQQKKDKAEARRKAAEERKAQKIAAAERKKAAAAAPVVVAMNEPPKGAPQPAAPSPAAPVEQPAPAPAPQAAAAPPPAAPAAPPQRPPQKLVMAGGHHITGIGFRPVGGGEVIVRSDGPLEYGISGEGKSVLLHLPSTAIPVANNRRPLDTQFFAGAVQRVVPLPVEGGTDVRIELRERAGYQLAQSGSVLTVTFSAPQ